MGEETLGHGQGVPQAVEFSVGGPPGDGLEQIGGGFFAKTIQGSESTVAAGLFQGGLGFDLQFFAENLELFRAQAGEVEKSEKAGRDRGPEFLEVGEFSRGDEGDDFFAKRFADTGEFSQTSGADQIPEVGGSGFQGASGGVIGAALKRVFSLELENGADLPKSRGGCILGHLKRVDLFLWSRETKGRVAVARLGGKGDAHPRVSAAFNDYVLTTSLEQGWVTNEQADQIRTVLTANPAVAALDLMEEQQLLPSDHVKTLRELIAQAGGQEESQDPAVVRAYLEAAIQMGASDLHLGPDAPALVRIHGQLSPLEGSGARFLAKAETEQLARSFLTAKQTARVEEHGSVDFCYDVPGLSRFRTSVVRQRRGWESVFRVISNRIRTMDELVLPPVLKTLTRYHNGLVLVTGPVGSGKSTTLAAMVDHINKERKDHIITLEDPIEYVFTPAGCQVSQREIGNNSQSFSSALRASLREDPDVIMVGEMRDLETISLAITASETGHLVLGTLHTSTAARTLDRLLDVFPIDQQAQIRTMVSESLRGIVCQQLIPRKDGHGRTLALEVLVNNPAVGNLIREAKTFMLPGVMQTGKKLGMRLMDDSLQELLNQNLITPEEAYRRAENKKAFAAAFAGQLS